MSRVRIAFCLILVLGVLFSSLTGCGNIDPAKATRILKAQGYTDIQIGGHAWFDCGDDNFSRSFTAKGPTGIPVKGSVCCDFLKDCTVRTK